MTIVRVLSGSLSSTNIDVVSPGDDVSTGKSALLGARSFLLYLTPAMYSKDSPAGGYAVVGGPAGVFSLQHGTSSKYLKIDGLSADLPSMVQVGKTTLPPVTKTAKQLLDEGPR